MRGFKPLLRPLNLTKIKKRDESKWVKMKKNVTGIEKSTKVVVLEIIDVNSCIVDFSKNHIEMKEIKIKDSLICGNESLKSIKPIDN